MARIVSDLSHDALGMILEYLNGITVFRLIIAGSTALTNKVLSSTRRFTLTWPYTERAIWPSILSRFSALESFQLSISVSGDLVEVHNMDLLSLSPKLRKLNLNFSNAFLSLLDLPPPDYVDGVFVPHLRSDIRARFKNLEELRCNWNMPTVMRKWDYSEFVKEACAWTVLPQVSVTSFGINEIEDAVTLPESTRSMSLDPRFMKGEEWLKTFRLPNSLTELRVSGAHGFGTHNLFDHLPTQLQALTVFQSRNTDFNISSPKLAHLTFLHVNHLISNTSFFTYLPPTMTTLITDAREAELECLAVLPPNLIHFYFHWNELFSSTTGKRINSSFHSTRMHNYDGLPADFFPNMRDSIVAKLPRSLKDISKSTLLLISPKDRGALPRNLRDFVDPLVVLPHHLEYVSTWPWQLKSFKTCQLTPSQTQELPRTLTRLSIDMCWPSSVEQVASERSHTHMLQILSKFRNLIDLTLEIDESFAAEQLFAIGAKVERLSLYKSTNSHNGPNEALQVEEEAPMDTQSSCTFDRLKKLHLDEFSLRLLHPLWPRIVPACTSLEVLSCLGIDATTPRHYLFPGEMLSALPNLTWCNISVESLDASLFPLLSKKLETLDLRQTPNSSYELDDLRLLPPSLQNIVLPLPNNKSTSNDPTLVLDKIVAEHFSTETHLRIGNFANNPPLFKRSTVPSSSLEYLLKVEREARQRSSSSRTIE